MNKGAVAGIGVVVVLVAGYAGATLWTGQVTERRHAEQLARVQGEVPGARPAERSYERGFFTSRSTTAFQIGCPAPGGAAPFRVTVTDAIRHGPFAGGTVAAAVIDSQVSLGGSEGERLNAMFTGAPMTVRTVVGFGGRFTSTVQSGAATLPIGEGAELAWQGLSGTVEGQTGASAFSYALKSPGLTITEPKLGSKVVLSGLAMKAEGVGGVKAAGLLGVGKSEGSLDSMQMSMALPAMPGAPGAVAAPSAPLTASFTGLKFTSDTRLDGELLAFASNFSGAGVVGGAKIDRFDMQASMKRLHAPTYQRVMERVAGMSKDCNVAAKEDPARLLETMQADFMALLKHNPEIALDKLTIDHAGQRGELSYSAGVQGLSAVDAQQPLMVSLMQGARLTATMRVPVAWVRRVAAESASRLQGTATAPELVDVMIDDAVAKGFVVRDGEHVTSRVEFAAGELKVNGKALPGGPPPRRP